MSIAPNPAFWDALAARYAAKPVDDPEAFERKISITKELITPDSQVLDVGCGTGSLALRLAPDAGHVRGLDLSDSMLQFARDKAAASQTENVSFHHGTLDDALSTFGAGSQDVVCAYSLLHLLPDRAAGLEQLFALLKPGGAFIASTVVLGDSWMPYRAILWTMQKLGKAPHVWVVDKQTVLDEIRAAGFDEVSAPDVGAKPVVVFTSARKPTC